MSYENVFFSRALNITTPSLVSLNLAIKYDEVGVLDLKYVLKNFGYGKFDIKTFLAME